MKTKRKVMERGEGWKEGEEKEKNLKREKHVLSALTDIPTIQYNEDISILKQFALLFEDINRSINVVAVCLFFSRLPRWWRMGSSKKGSGKCFLLLASVDLSCILSDWHAHVSDPDTHPVFVWKH